MDLFVLFGFISVIWLFLNIFKFKLFNINLLELLYWNDMFVNWINGFWFFLYFNRNLLLLFGCFKNLNIMLLVFLFCFLVWNVCFKFLIVL